MSVPILLFAAALAAAPEITRPVAPPQAIGAAHALRNVPEACTRIEGVFTAEGYSPSLVPRVGCRPRAPFEPGIGAQPPSGEGWILNDLLRVPRADRPACIATISVWRHPGALAPMQADGQQRVRLYLDAARAPAAQQPRFAASLQVTPECSAP